MASPLIEHEGVVDSVAARTVRVRITSRSACGSCRARQACGMAEAQEKIVEVATPCAAEYAPGEAVRVGVRRHAGVVAVALAYVGALVVLVGTLCAATLALGWSDMQAAAAAVAAVVLYYGLLWLCRRAIEHTIQFTITKI